MQHVILFTFLFVMCRAPVHLLPVFALFSLHFGNTSDLFASISWWVFEQVYRSACARSLQPLLFYLRTIQFYLGMTIDGYLTFAPPQLFLVN